MFNLLRADLYVLVRSRALWIALAASSAMAVGYYASAHLIAVGAYDESISGSVAGFSDAMALPLLGSMLIGVVVASDLENRTVHDRLLAASRSALVAVKTVMALVVAVVYRYGIEFFYVSEADQKLLDAYVDAFQAFAHPQGDLQHLTA